MAARALLRETLPSQVLAALAAIGAGSVRPLMTLVFGGLANQFNNTQDPDLWKQQINRLVLFLVYLFIAQWALVFIYGTLFSISAIHMSVQTRAAYFRSAIRRDIGTKAEGNTATELSSSVESIEDALAEKLGLVIEAVSTIVVSWVIALTRSWRLALVLTVVTVILLGSNFGTAAIDAKIEQRLHEIDIRAASLAEESFEGIIAVISTASEDKFAERYRILSNRARSLAYWKSPVLAAQYSISYFMVLSAYALAFWYGTHLLNGNNNQDAGSILVVVLCINQGTNAMRLILPIYGVLAKARASMISLRKVIHCEVDIDPLGSSGTHVESILGNVQFRNVDFSYPSRLANTVVKDLELDLVAGQTTALVGPSGCGKSTIIALLGRWYDPSSGSITLDGSNIKDLNVRSFRSNIRFVQQDTVLFNDTVYSNVAHGLHGTPLEKLGQSAQRKLVKQACIEANARDFIEQLPDAYDTHLGVGGNLLSGGQKQRIAIARAIVCSPKILVFDEATSALDSQSAASVESAIQKVSQGRTTVLVTHKLAMARRAYRIYVLDKGQVVEFGDHESLKRAKGLYERMYGQQHVLSDSDEEKNQFTIERDGTMEIRDGKEGGSHHIINQQLEEEEKHSLSKKSDATFLTVVYALWTENKRIRLLLTASVVAGIIGAAVYPGQAILFAESITVFQSKEDNLQSSSNFWSLMWFVVAIGAFCVYMAVGTLTSIAGSLTLHTYRNMYFISALHQPLSFFSGREHSPGSLTASLSSHTTHLQSAITVLNTLVITIVNIGSSGILTLIVAWKLALVALFGSLPVVILAGFLRIRAQTRGQQDISKAFMDSARYASEAVSALQTIASLTMESAVCDELERRMKASLHYFYKRIFVTMPLFAFSQAGNLLGMALAFWYGGNLLANGEISAFQIWVVFTAVVAGGDAAAEFFSSSNSIAQATDGWNAIHDLQTTSRASALKHLVSKTHDLQPPISLSLSNVSFIYTQSSPRPVLLDVTFDFLANRRYAIVGPSGCGKSTLLLLLANLHTPTSGTLSANGIPLASIPPSIYRPCVAVVTQDTHLFNGTLAENILLGVPDASFSSSSALCASHRALLESAARQAHILDFIRSLPDGFATRCGREGTSFSGGQRQRLALARALAQQPAVLLLDEPTSALDASSEAEVLKALKEASAGRTTVLVTHRLVAARDADEVLLLREGKVAERGTHEKLMASRGDYWALWQAQSVERGAWE